MNDNEPKFTPGERTITEWTTRGSASSAWTVHVRVTAGEVTVCTMECPADDAEAVEATRADARLDAAAPKMYEALQRALPMLEQLRLPGPAMSDPWGPPHDLIGAVRAVLAMVEGKP
ncbi:MAG TPA: hypothetical protein VFR62_10065 [Gemmatimonadales bacterium]|nr:hypothetical protein [Gemmatimonadales bacterium]